MGSTLVAVTGDECGASRVSGMMSIGDLRKRVLYVALGRCVKDDAPWRAFHCDSEAFLRSVAREFHLSEWLVDKEMIEAFDSAIDMPRESTDEIYRRLWSMLGEESF